MERFRDSRVAGWTALAVVVTLGILATAGAAFASADTMLAASRVLMVLAIAGLVVVGAGAVRQVVLESRRRRGDDGPGGGGGDEPDWPFPPGPDAVEEELQRILREEASKLR